MENKEKIKIIKRINERMAVYQRQGLTDSYYYKKMKSKIELLGIPNSETKGRFKVSLKKTDIAKINPEDLAVLDSMPSLKQERQKAKEQGHKTTREQNEYIKNFGNLSNWVEENIDNVYKDARGGSDIAQKIEEMFQEKGKGKGTRNMDYSKIYALIDKYEKEKAREKSLLNDSEFFSNDIHGDK